MKFVFFLLLIVLSLAAREIKSELHLKITEGGLLSTVVVQRTLGALGFKADLHRYANNDSMIEMEMILNGKKPFDPKALSEALDEHKITLKSAHLKNKTWIIAVDASQIFWNIPVISEDEGAQIERSSFSSWLMVNKVLGITIEAPYSDKWYPEIAVLDANMQTLVSLREFKSKDRMSFLLPEHAMYLKVSNLNGMKMLKEGIWVESANDEQ